jgi:effector-binding domain-containing protein
MVCRRTVLLAAVALWLLHPLPALAQAPAAPDKPEPAGEEVILTSKTIAYSSGAGRWVTAYETLLDAFKTVYGALERHGLKAAGPAMTIITEFDADNFRFQAAVPITEEPADSLGADIAIGKSPEGKAFKFVHRGAYQTMDPLFTVIVDFFVERKLEMRDLYVEEFETDVLSTPSDKLVVHVFMPVK